MNERIKEILRECGGVLRDEDGTELPTYVLVGNAPEKFAELIVKECCKIMAEHASRPAGVVKRNVKEHFGVEE